MQILFQVQILFRCRFFFRYGFFPSYISSKQWSGKSRAKAREMNDRIRYSGCSGFSSFPLPNFSRFQESYFCTKDTDYNHYDVNPNLSPEFTQFWILRKVARGLKKVKTHPAFETIRFTDSYIEPISSDVSTFSYRVEFVASLISSGVQVSHSGARMLHYLLAELEKD